MNYACPKHSDVILFVDNTKGSATSNRRSITTFGVRFTTTVPEANKPKECPKCGRWYHRHECVAAQ